MTKIHEHELAIIGAMRATGATGQEIADELGISKVTACRHLKKEEVREIIRGCESVLAARGYARSTANIIRTVELYDPDIKIKPDDKHALAIQEAGLRCSLKIAEGIGLTPSNSLAPSVSQIYVAGNAQIISPMVDRALTHALMIPDATICSSETDE